MSSEFVFRISPMDTAALMPQVSCALEAYNEQESRRKYPGTWRLVDRLRRVPKAPAEVRRKRRRRRTVLGLIDWLLGMYIFVPIVSAPDQLGHLLPYRDRGLDAAHLCGVGDRSAKARPDYRYAARTARISGRPSGADQSVSALPENRENRLQGRFFVCKIAFSHPKGKIQCATQPYPVHRSRRSGSDGR